MQPALLFEQGTHIWVHYCKNHRLFLCMFLEKVALLFENFNNVWKQVGGLCTFGGASESSWCWMKGLGGLADIIQMFWINDCIWKGVVANSLKFSRFWKFYFVWFLRRCYATSVLQFQWFLTWKCKSFLVFVVLNES